MMQRTRFLIFSVITSILLSACVPTQSPLATFSNQHGVANTGDIVVTNYYGDSALLLDQDGNYKKLLYNVNNNQEQVVGVNWNPSTKEIILSINGVPDRIMAIDPLTGDVRQAIMNPQLNGNTFGVAVDNSGNYIVIETSRLEKFTASGGRINNGTFPTGNILGSMTQVNIMLNDDYLLCGYSGDRVKIYDSAMNELESKQSGISATTNAYGCNKTQSGNIIAAWEGTNDTIVLYNEDMSSEIASFNDTSILSSPRNITELGNGHFLVADAGYDHLVELSAELEFVRTLGGGVLNDPFSILEIPSF